MTASRDPERLIRAFLDEGLTELPDRVYDAVRFDIDRTRQRVVIVPWRTPRMSNSVRLAIGLAAVVVVAVAGIALLTGRDSDVAAPPSPSPSPSASAAGGASTGPVAITAALRPGSDIGQTTLTDAPGRKERRGTVWSPTFSASDPRLEGTMTISADEDQYPGADGPESFVFGSSTTRIENADGAWQGSETTFLVADQGSGSTVVLVGEGAHAGLYAALDMTDPGNITGVIFPAPPPPLPDTPAPAASAAASPAAPGSITPVVVTASLQPGNDIGNTTFTAVDGRAERRGTIWAPTITASDPRLQGSMTIASPQDTYGGPDGGESFVFGSGTYRIENADGAWQGSHSSFAVADKGGGSTVVLVGEGRYAGLFAALDVTDSANIRGVIFPAPPPAVPTAP
jgi:hypothetical protein